MDSIHSSVQDYYGKTLTTNKDLQTNACTSCCTTLPQYIKDILATIPQEIIEKYYGCGLTIPIGIEQLTILDLGSGCGRDCYLLSTLVGKEGTVYGIDMTQEMIEVAIRNQDAYSTQLGYNNMTFLKGYIENIAEVGIKPQSVDIVVSNCVVNLSPDKLSVLQGVYDCLREGGEFYFSDVYCDRRLDKTIQENKILWGECISGALYIEDFKRYCHQVGFSDPRIMEQREFTIHNPKLQQLVGNASFYSITFRLFKLPELETKCEDYGQIAIYNGTIPHSLKSYQLDDHHCFPANKEIKVCGNTADMLEKTWLSKYFTILGNKDNHYGLFDCSTTSCSSTTISSCC